MPHPYSHIPELMNLEAGRGIVRIPVELDVPFTPRVRALVDTAEFQRLAHISQLGLAACDRQRSSEADPTNGPRGARNRGPAHSNNDGRNPNSRERPRGV